MGAEGRRRVKLRHMSNDGLFRLYDSDLVLRLHNAKNLSDTRKMLARFKEYLSSYPPSPELAKGFLAQYANRKLRTLARYGGMIKGFMKWYGEPIDDFKVKVPKSVPPYTEDSEIEKLLSAIEHKKTHKACIVRDSLLVDAARNTGMRREELSKLEPRDIHTDFLIAHGKGGKDRIIFLPPDTASRLHQFTKGMTPDEKVFKLKPASISNKIRLFAKKAQLKGFHTHLLRHKYATDLVEKGANIKAVQQLLGHENLATTEVYLAVTDRHVRDAVALLANRNKPSEQPPTEQSRHKMAWELPEYQKKPSAEDGPANPWMSALGVMLDPANLCQALDPERVKEVELAKLPLMDKTAVSQLLRPSRKAT